MGRCSRRDLQKLWIGCGSVRVGTEPGLEPKSDILSLSAMGGRMFFEHFLPRYQMRGECCGYSQQSSDLTAGRCTSPAFHLFLRPHL